MAFDTMVVEDRRHIFAECNRRLFGIRGSSRKSDRQHRSNGQLLNRHSSPPERGIIRRNYFVNQYEKNTRKVSSGWNDNSIQDIAQSASNQSRGAAAECRSVVEA